MALNPLQLMKLVSTKKQFEERHPRVISFFNHEMKSPLPEGSVMEMSITRPGEKPVSTNLKLTAQDVELLKELMKLEL
ncbi:MAG: hypothetical protein IKE58_04660 [Blautia sp.]|nr:hypothetical protein [Blautia sp.]